MKFILNGVSKILTWVGDRMVFQALLGSLAILYEYVICKVVFDPIPNFWYLVQSYLPKNRNRVEYNLSRLEQACQAESMLEKNNFLIACGYKYKFDGINGFPDWKPRFKRVLAVRDFSGDCDDFAIMSHWVFANKKYEGGVFAIVPYDLNLYHRMHMVYVNPYGVYSSGRIHRYNGVGWENQLECYLNDRYKDVALVTFLT